MALLCGRLANSCRPEVVLHAEIGTAGQYREGKIGPAKPDSDPPNQLKENENA